MTTFAAKIICSSSDLSIFVNIHNQYWCLFKNIYVYPQKIGKVYEVEGAQESSLVFGDYFNRVVSRNANVQPQGYYEYMLL
jgi:hypothetical protein